MYKVGDEVRFRDAPGTVDQGPYESAGLRGTVCVVLMTGGPDEGRALAVKVSELEPASVVFAKGDRVRVGRDGDAFIVEAGPYAGHHGPWYALRDRDDKVFPSAGTSPILTLVSRGAMCEHEGVTYDLTARYRDRDGDVWRFERQPDGSVLGAHGSGAITPYSDSLSYAVSVYGPLHKT
ncbi:phiSA1p31-related protein [Streptomyces sp. NPDC048603]|uniref:phiSA1p31-related protein n=1 Tax=Streptomyces sp. NPDC048603 TaxID=3365577 RepID=UPI00371B4B2A